MQLIVKRSDEFVREFHFTQGPVYIGSVLESHVCLDDESISQEHAVICGADQTNWYAEHLCSKNSTLVNNQLLKKKELTDGDVITIGGYTIEVFIDRIRDASRGLHESANLTSSSRTPKHIIRRYDQPDSPDIKMPPKRAKDYNFATLAIEKSKSLQDIVKTLFAITVQQYNMLHSYIAIRQNPKEDIKIQIGKRRTGQTISLNEVVFSELIQESLEQNEFILIPMLPKDKLYERIRSAIIAPIVSPAGCHGVVYIDNAVDDAHYNLTDLDYLMLLTTQISARLYMKNIIT